MPAGMKCASRSPALRMALTMLRGAPAVAPGRGISSRTVHQGRAVGSSAARLQRRAAALGAVRPLAAAAASFGGEGPPLKVFPRLKERDPYRLLGVDKEATYEEIQSARNFLVEEHKTHVPGVEAIDGAFDKIIDQKLKERKRVKGIKLDKKKKDDVLISLGPLDRVRDAISVPPQKVILQRAFVYAFLVVWSLYQSAATGPAFQVAVGFGLTAYYIHDKRAVKNLWSCLGQALLGLFLGWLAGSIIPVYLPLFPASFSPETVAALFAFAAMWVTATFFK